MNDVVSIPKKEFFRRFDVKEIDLVRGGLFTERDMCRLVKFQEHLSLAQKLFLLPSYFLFAIKNPKFVSTFILPKFGLSSGVRDNYGILPLKDRGPICNCILKSSIAASFSPRVILEVGTYLGWGAASFKKACPEAKVYTINPKADYKSNNPIGGKSVGYFYREKGLKVEQIWVDSAFFDYSSISRPDVVYIDGNHSYEYVYGDLENASRVVRKCVIVDDFVPRGSSQLYGPWNESVVRATCDFVKNNGLFKYAFWIEDTPLCVLIK